MFIALIVVWVEVRGCEREHCYEGGDACLHVEPAPDVSHVSRFQRYC
jgi:hypothetical protein